MYLDVFRGFRYSTCRLIKALIFPGEDVPGCL